MPQQREEAPPVAGVCLAGGLSRPQQVLGQRTVRGSVQGRGGGVPPSVSRHQVMVSVRRVRDFPEAEARSPDFGAMEGRCRSPVWVGAGDRPLKLSSLQDEGCRRPTVLAVECPMVFGPLPLLSRRVGVVGEGTVALPRWQSPSLQQPLSVPGVERPLSFCSGGVLKL